MPIARKTRHDNATGRITRNRRPKPTRLSKIVVESLGHSETSVVVSPARVADQQVKSCWRCKRYKKKCNPGEVCDACITSSGFRVWPSTLGCRRGNLHTFAFTIIPGDVFDAVKEVGTQQLNTRAPSWRSLSQSYKTDLEIASSENHEGIWNKLLLSMLSSSIYGPGILELIIIGQHHQKAVAKPDSVLQSAAIVLDIVLDLYHHLVSTKVDRKNPLTSEEVIEKFLAIRKATIAFMDRFLLACLTARINAWPATMIGCSLSILGSVVLADIIVTLPPALRAKGWPNLHRHILDLRSYLYSMARDLLTILARDAALLDMDCWTASVDTELGPTFLTPGTSRTEERSIEGMRILEDDAVVYDSMVRLKLWREQYSFYLQGDLWMVTPPLGVDLLIIMSLSRLFVPDAHTKTLTFETTSGVTRPVYSSPARSHSNEENHEATTG